MPTEMRVTVLLVSHNQPRYLQAAIDSVLGQSYADWQLLVLDNGSTDTGVHRILREATLHPMVSVYRFNPSDVERAVTIGYASLFNWGAANSDGELLAFLCDDDLYTPDRLERMVAEIAGEREIAYGSQRQIDADGNAIGVRATQGVLLDAYHAVDCISVVMTRRAFVAAGGFPTEPWLWRDADSHLWRRLRDLSLAFYPVPGGPTDVKRFRVDSATSRLHAGEMLL